MSETSELLKQARKVINKHPKEALALALEAEEQAYKTHDDKGLAWSILTQGMCHLEEGNFSRAQKCLQESLDYSHKAQDKGLQAAASLQMARFCHMQGDYKAISLNAYEALAAARDINDDDSVGAALNLLGSSFDYFGMYEKALEYYFQAIDIYESLENKEVYVVLINVSNIYWQLGQEMQSPKHYTLALENLEKALDGVKEYGSKRQEGLCLSNLGNVYKDLGNYQKALGYLQKAEDVLKESNQLAALPLIYKTWGDTYTLTGSLREGLDYYRRALSLLDNYPNAKEKSEVFLGMGANYIKQENYSLALSVLTQALEFAQSQGAKPDISDIHLHLNYAYEGLGDFVKALEQHKEYHRLKAELSQERARQRLEGLMAQFEVERLKKEKEIAYIKQVEMAALNKRLEQKNLELQKLNKRLEQLSIRDGLTKVFNRRYLDDYLVKEWQRSQRYQSPLSLMMGDIDSFKQINDNFSHTVGDEVLKILGRLLKSSTRDSDVVARYGGEEFVIVFPETELDKAVQAAEKLRLAIEVYPWSEVRENLEVTISAGVAITNDVKHYRDLLEQADEKLYEAKYSGKNRVCY